MTVQFIPGRFDKGINGNQSVVVAYLPGIWKPGNDLRPRVEVVAEGWTGVRLVIYYPFTGGQERQVADDVMGPDRDLLLQFAQAPTEELRSAVWDSSIVQSRLEAAFSFPAGLADEEKLTLDEAVSIEPTNSTHDTVVYDEPPYTVGAGVEGMVRHGPSPFALILGATIAVVLLLWVLS